MTETTALNPAADIYTAMLETLTTAQLDGEPLLAAARLDQKAPRGLDHHFHGPGPVCLILDEGIDEQIGPIGTRVGLLDCSLLVAVRSDAEGLDVLDPMLELLRVRSAAVNAVAAADLPHCSGWVGQGRWIPPLQWGKVQPDSRPGSPWLACLSPCRIAWRIADSHSH
jgi:hypothetical protein